LVDALVIAGGKGKDKLRSDSEVAAEALIPIGNKFMVEYVVEALQASAQVERIVVVGPLVEIQKVFSHKPDIILAMEGESAIDSVLNGIEMLNSNGKILIVTADIPLINAAAIEDFLQACNDSSVDLYYPIVPKEANEAKYPTVKRTYVTLREGIFTGGNMFLVNPKIVARCAVRGRQLVKLRKSPVALSGLIGWGFILKLLLKMLSLKEVEQKFSDLLGIKGRAVVSAYPEIGIDVDKPSDLQLVNEVIIPSPREKGIP